MEFPHAYQPELDETGKFWKGVQTAYLQAFSKVHWNTDNKGEASHQGVGTGRTFPILEGECRQAGASTNF